MNRHAGQAGNSYRFNRTSERAWEESVGAQTVCYEALQYVYNYNQAKPHKEDCLSAIPKLRANSNTVCPPERSSEPRSPPPLVSEGTCKITVQGAAGKCIPSSQLADEATVLADACANLNRATSGSRRLELATDARRYNGMSISLDIK